MATSSIPMPTVQRIKADVSGGSSYTLSLEDGHSYLIHMMTSSNESARAIVISRLGNYYKMLELEKGSYQSYYTESLSSTAWQLSVTYRTVVNILDFG